MDNSKMESTWRKMITSSPYKIWSYSFNTARTNLPMGLSGTDLIVFRNTNPVLIRLDDIRNDEIPITSCEPTNPIIIAGIPFKEIYLTNSANPGGFIEFIVTFGGTSSQIVDELRKPKGFDRILDSLGLFK